MGVLSNNKQCCAVLHFAFLVSLLNRTRSLYRVGVDSCCFLCWYFFILSASLSGISYTEWYIS